MGDKCLITKETCALSPTGLTDFCFNGRGCPYAKVFLKEHDLLRWEDIPEDTLQDLIDGLKDELDWLEIKFPLEQVFLKRCFGRVGKYLHDKMKEQDGS